MGTNKDIKKIADKVLDIEENKGSIYANWHFWEGEQNRWNRNDFNNIKQFSSIKAWISTLKGKHDPVKIGTTQPTFSDILKKSPNMR